MIFNKFLDPKNDFAFKRIFGTEKNQDILIDFINAIIGFEDDARIQKVVFLKTNQDPEIAYKKQSLVDVLCTDEHGRQYIIEMQVARTTGFEKRAQYYAAKAYSGQLQQGDNYDKLKAIIFIAITDFVMFPEKSTYKSNHQVLDCKTHSHDLKDFSFTFLELPKFTKNIDELNNVVERWMYFLKNAGDTHEKDIERVAGLDVAITQAYEELNRFSWSEIELNTYERETKRERDERSVLLARVEDAEAKGKAAGLQEGIQQGMQEGIERGMQEGIERGMQEGIERGMQEGIERGIQEGARRERKELAKKMMTLGLNPKTISENTGLSVEEVDALA